MQLEIPPAWRELIDNLKSVGFFEACIAGGALRDLDNERPVKDLDLFVTDRGEHTYDMLVKALGPGTSIIHRNYAASYPGFADVAEVWSFTPHDIRIPVQVVCTELRHGPQAVIARCDFGMSRIAFDGEKVIMHEDYRLDKALKRFTLCRCDDTEQFERSFARWQRLREKYPEYVLHVPMWACQYIPRHLKAATFDARTP